MPPLSERPRRCVNPNPKISNHRVVMGVARPKTMKTERTREGEALAEPWPNVAAAYSPTMAPRGRPPNNPDDGIFEGGTESKYGP